MARDALALADHLELDTFHLVGMSMGGAIAQEMALLAERLRTLTLVVTFAGGGNWAAERARLWSEIRGLIDQRDASRLAAPVRDVGGVLRATRSASSTRSS